MGFPLFFFTEHANDRQGRVTSVIDEERTKATRVLNEQCTANHDRRYPAKALTVSPPHCMIASTADTALRLP